MLLQCPECRLQVSSNAEFCPHCGNPFKLRKYKRTRKRKRLPNGFGQISEIKGKNLRKPFRAMVNAGKDENGRPISKMLKPEAYFATYNDAYAALVEYNKNPYDLDSVITMKELYDKWLISFERSSYSDSYKNVLKAAWRYCSAIYPILVRDLRPHHIKSCITDGTVNINGTDRHVSGHMAPKVVAVIDKMLQYAMDRNIIDTNCASGLTIGKELGITTFDSTLHKPFTREDVHTLWNNLPDHPELSTILIACYSGWRPQELCKLQLENINLIDWSFTGGLKTKAGINRTVPIHPAIRPLVEAKYKEAVKMRRSTLIGVEYQRYRAMFEKTVSAFCSEPHVPHDTRVTFATYARECDMDENAIKRIMGHEISDITERVYVKRTYEWLSSECAKLSI